MNKNIQAKMQNLVLVNDGTSSNLQEIKSLDELNSYSLIGLINDLTLPNNPDIILFAKSKNLKMQLKMTQSVYNNLKEAYAGLNGNNPKTMALIDEVNGYLDKVKRINDLIK